MGLRKDLDKIGVRYIYYLMDKDNVVLYVGTARNYVARYKQHLKALKTKKTAPIYQYCNQLNIKPRLKIVAKLTGTYAQAECIEIEHIVKHKDTCLNFYNNPNKAAAKKYMKKRIYKTKKTTKKQRV